MISLVENALIGSRSEGTFFTLAHPELESSRLRKSHLILGFTGFIPGETAHIRQA